MKILKRIFVGIMWLTYLILIVIQFLWWFIPLLFGVSHEVVIDNYFDFITDYSDGLFED
jgi:hypothetical protein